jgi:hypothetical protein
MITVFDKRPPFVRFEEREFGINKVLSQKMQRPVPNVVVMACITPAGSKDCVERPAEDWLKEKNDKAIMGEYPLAWAQHHSAAYEAWKKGNELPREGTPIKTWQMATRDVVSRCLAINIPVVEDLAELPDSGLSTLGIDGRYWRDLARGWINEGKDKGLNAKALADANARIDMLQQQYNEAMAELRAIRQQVGTVQLHDEPAVEESPRRRGRPPKQVDAA